MAWIKVIDETDATGDLKKLYAENLEPWGGVDNILKIHSIAPETLQAHLVLYKTLMHGHGALPKPQREMIGIVVSSINHCHY